MKRILFFAGLFFAMTFMANAQDIQFTGSARSVVGVGETFNLSYTVNGQASNFRGPSLSGFDVISGPFTSTSSSIRSVNGRTTMSISNTFSYLLQASREGTFEIASASVQVDRKTYKSNVVTIKVVRNGSSKGGSQGMTSGGRQSSSGAKSGGNDVFLKAFVTNDNPLQGEEVVVTYKIFTKVPISQISISKLSSFQGFWSQNLIKDNEKFNQYTQTINGEQYIVADIRKIALFPLKSGRLTIDPLEMECVAQIKRQVKTKTGDPFFDDFFNDSFFNSNVATVEKSLKSNALYINVRPLPDANKPSDFSGAVGNFSFTSSLDKEKVNANEPINLKCTVTGQGNLQLIDRLNVTFPPDFETYDPKVTSNINTTASGVSGSQIFEYLIIPRKPGRFTIKPIPFTFYDLKTHRYTTVSTPAYTIDVGKGTGEAGGAVYSGGNKEDIKYIGSDIRHIKNQLFSLRRVGSFFFGSLGFYLLILIPVFLFLAIIIIWRKRMEQQSNVVLMKNLKATKVARKRLKKASDFLKEGKQELFYEEISQALWGYLSDKFSIPKADLSMDSVSDALMQKSVNEEIIHQFMDTLNNTEFTRFAPGEKNQKMDKIYNEALDIISKIERELK
ncbi:MAG: BatD family protein [Bacteroidota bacterium]|nr:BatD family protein [Bacteroidota bacterium]